MQTSQRKSFPASPLKRARTNKLPATKPNLATPIIIRIAGKNKTVRLQESARLVAPPMLCYNQAATGATARAVGVALGESAARIVARSRVGSMRQLYKV